METVADIFYARANDSSPALYFEDSSWSGMELVFECASRAQFLLANRLAGAFHVGILLDNVPEYAFWIGACALADAKFVALNTTRKGSDLTRDIVHTNCQFLVTEKFYQEQIPSDTVASFGNHFILAGNPDHVSCMADYREMGLPICNASSEDVFCLIFTSGTSGAPKAVIYSNRRVMRNALLLVERSNLTSRDIAYVPMPLFHSTGLIVGMLSHLACGGAFALCRKFSASKFLADVRKYGATTFAYVGKPLAYILATEENADDHDNPLKIAFGSEAPEVDIANFSRRYGCHVVDNYGSSEGCITILRTPDTPSGSIGVALGGRILVMNPETGLECPRAAFEKSGVLMNGNEAIGELVNLDGGAIFEGYWNNSEAQERRIRNGAYWSGDLSYRDSDGFFYFAGRDSEWLRVDGENLSAVQIEQVIVRHPGIALAAVYGVADTLVGDRVMAALEVVPGVNLDMAEFREFLLKQEDFGSKWMPTFVRICETLPTTHTNKVLKSKLKSESWACSDPIWWIPSKGALYRRLTAEDAAGINEIFSARQRNQLLRHGA